MATPLVTKISALAAAGALALLWGLPNSARADCAADLGGEIYCGGGRCVLDRTGQIWRARFYDGDAALTRNGAVVCGRGRCAADTHGGIFCSSVEGGAVLTDIRGRVRCYGDCEPATLRLLRASAGRQFRVSARTIGRAAVAARPRAC